MDLDDVQEYFQCEDFWSSFEENLGSFDYTSFAQYVSADNLPDMSSDHADATRSDARCAVENKLNDWNKTIWGSFPDWLRQLSPPDPTKKINLNSSDALFLNFNYTLTLENLYSIDPDNVIHIHGKQGDPPNELLLGHGGLTVPEHDPFAEYTVDDPPDPNDQLAIEEAIGAAKGYAEKWEKPVAKNISDHATLFSSLSSVEEIYAYGFSFSDIDRKYITAIQSHLSASVVKIASWHSARDIVKTQQCLGKDVTFIRLENIVT